LIRATARGGWRLLAVCALVLVASVGSRYLHRCGIESRALDLVVRATPSWSIFNWTFYFVMGITAASISRELSQWLERYRWGLLACAVILLTLNMIEADALLQTTRQHWIAFYDTISYHLSATASILCLLALADFPSPLDKMLTVLGRQSYGIYLLHYQVMEVVARLIYHALPAFLSYPILLVLLVLACGLGMPLLVMKAVCTSPVRGFNRYLFG
jgi:surface polysaccharide O-acyltransferase-like enzyme